MPQKLQPKDAPAARPVVHFRLRDGRIVSGTALPGATVRDLALELDVEGVVGECGGNCACATCHVYIDEAWRERVGSPEPGGVEDGMLEFSEGRTAGSRLACQVPLTAELDGLTVEIPPGPHS